jgi:hypothetical protein
MATDLEQEVAPGVVLLERQLHCVRLPVQVVREAQGRHTHAAVRSHQVGVPHTAPQHRLRCRGLPTSMPEATMRSGGG